MYYFVSYRCTATKQDVSRGCLEVLVCSSLSSSDSSPVCNYLLQTNGYHVRGVDPSDLRMSMKNSLPVNQKTREVITSSLWRTHGQWFCFLFCVRQYVPSVLWCSESFFLGASFVVKTRKRLHCWQPHRCNCDQRWHKSSIHVVGGNHEADTITQENQMEHFWSNFNTRLIVFSWTHCCQDVNFLGDFVSSFLKLKLTQSFFSVYKIRRKILKKG